MNHLESKVDTYTIWNKVLHLLTVKKAKSISIGLYSLGHCVALSVFVMSVVTIAVRFCSCFPSRRIESSWQAHIYVYIYITFVLVILFTTQEWLN